jgi:16S rRNA (cytosine967-C5)-methyltransferase
VNAVLRGYARQLEPTRKELTALRLSDPALGWSHPEWLVKRWTSVLGPDNTLALLEWNNTPAAAFARVNTLKTEPGKLLERWREEEVEYAFVTRSWLPDNLVFRLESHPPLPKLRSFRDGWFYVQDPSTLLAPLVLDPQPGEQVLDLCAAPGGKTTFMAQLMNGEGRIVAGDSSEKRLQLLQENCTRLGATRVDPTAIPAGFTPLPALRSSQFDRVLVDAPCSNTGVIRRRVDLRWRIQPAELERLADVQGSLLAKGAALVQPGGCLVYSTCSLEPEENTRQIGRFLEKDSAFALEDEVTVSPWEDHVDGAYAASLKRIR